MSIPSLVSPAVLQYGDILIGDAGAKVKVTGSVDPSNAMMGCITVETEIGTLYLGEDDEVTVIRASDYKPDETWLTLIEHEHGVDWALSDTEDEAYAVVDGFVSEWWNSEKNCGIDANDDAYIPLPEDPKEARDAYFDGHDTESYIVQAKIGR